MIEYGQLLALACPIQMLSPRLVWLHYFLLALLLLPQGPLAESLAADPVLAANRACVVAALILFGLGPWQLCFQDGRPHDGSQRESRVCARWAATGTRRSDIAKVRSSPTSWYWASWLTCQTFQRGSAPRMFSAVSSAVIMA